jgi:hypothetical protein
LSAQSFRTGTYEEGRQRVERTELASATVWLGATDAFSRKIAFLKLSPVPRANLEGQQRVDLTRSPSRRRMTGICAKLTAGVDVKLSFAVNADRDFCLFPYPDNRTKP